MTGGDVIATGKRKPAGGDAPDTMRSRSAAINAARAAYESDLAYKMEPVANPRRRKRALADHRVFLREYFPDTFRQSWNPNREQIVEAIFDAVRYGADQAIAAPRGEGKSTITRCLTIYCVLAGLVRFPLLCAANGQFAEQMLDEIKSKLVHSRNLVADFPELLPCAELDRVPARAANQQIAGHHTNAEWLKNQIIFPSVPDLFCPKCGTYTTEFEPGRQWYYCQKMVRETDGRRVSWRDAGCGRRFKFRGFFPFSGAVIATRGLNSPIRGVNVRDQRPDIVIIDDPETRESADSPLQTRNRERVIESDIGGLAGPDSKVSRLILCTTQNRHSLAWRFTDREEKPAFNGIRQRLLATEPERVDMWVEYVEQRRRDKTEGDRFGRTAYAFYLENRDEMDLGAVVTNPERYVADLCPDGTPQQVSALQFCYDTIADNGLDAFLTEYQNEPPEDENAVDELDPVVIRSRFSGYGRRVVPEGAAYLTAGVDVGKRALHWTVTAWFPNGTGFVVDYGVDEFARSGETDGAIDAAIVRALDDRRDLWHGDGSHDARNVFAYDDGQVRRIDRVLIDAGYRTGAIYEFTRRAGAEYEPAMGYETDNAAQFRGQSTKRSKYGDGFKLTKQAAGLWLVVMESVAWKRWIHDRMREPVGAARSLTLFELAGERLRDDHTLYCKHITAEREEMEFRPGHPPRIRWSNVNRANHWLDATYMSAVAAARLGLRRDGSQPEHVAAGSGWTQSTPGTSPQWFRK